MDSKKPREASVLVLSVEATSCIVEEMEAHRTIVGEEIDLLLATGTAEKQILERNLRERSANVSNQNLVLGLAGVESCRDCPNDRRSGNGESRLDLCKLIGAIHEHIGVSGLRRKRCQYAVRPALGDDIKRGWVQGIDVSLHIG